MVACQGSGRPSRASSWRPRTPNRAETGQGLPCVSKTACTRCFKLERWRTRCKRQRARSRSARTMGSGSQIAGTRSRRVSSASTQASIRSVLQANGARPFTFCASAISTCQPASSSRSCTNRAPFIDSIAARIGSRCRSSRRVRPSRPSASGGAAPTSTVAPSLSSRWKSRRLRLRSKPAYNIVTGLLSIAPSDKLERVTGEALLHGIPYYRNARQSFPLVSAGFAAVGFATGCHRLQPRGSTRAPSCSTYAAPAVVARAFSIVAGAFRRRPLVVAGGAEAALVDVAVRVARRVPALQARLVDAHSAEVVTVREEARVDRHAAAVGVCADSRHPGADTLWVEGVVPARIERVGGIDPATVPADLDHLRPAPQPEVGRSGLRGAAHNAAEMDRAGLPRVVRVAHVVLFQLTCSPARDVQPPVVDGEVDIGHERRNGSERLERRRLLRGVRGLGRDRDGLRHLPVAILPVPQPHRRG